MLAHGVLVGTPVFRIPGAAVDVVEAVTALGKAKVRTAASGETAIRYVVSMPLNSMPSAWWVCRHGNLFVSGQGRAEQTDDIERMLRGH